MKINKTHTKTLHQLDTAFKSARTIDELNQVLQDFLFDLGFSMFSFTYYSYYPNSLNKLKYDFASKAFKQWHQHYLAEHYEEVDSTLAQSYRATLPTYWVLKDQLKNAKTAKEKKMRKDSIAFGAEKGISFPIHGPEGDFAMFLVVQMVGEKCLDHWQTLQYELFTVGYYYYSYLQALLLKEKKPTAKHQLNQREIQCLQLIAEHHAIAVIAKKLHITERTVNYHIQRLNKKLGTKNKHQSVMKAMREGIIPPFEKEV